ncbi:glycosyltransferase family 2 protein [Candidatus Saccharibacteria bacterium]|nr:glycosyltransferase family 2 protein [Candidatus Saccharibacteria bacterium]MBQ6130448.1 glycosyltransferase family 2 protein [Candidatus Saccharibacteria bacterium]
MPNSLKSSLVRRLKSSCLLPALYTAITRPFSRRLRHLAPPAQLPKIPEHPKRVSVVVPNYNYGRYLETRIDSILNQTYPIFELIILDDASTDNSKDIINHIISEQKNSSHDINIRFLPNRKNSGKSISQWQKGFEEAKGDYVWLAEADDLSDNNFLAILMEKFDQDPKLVLAYSNSVAINSNGHTFLYDFMCHSVDKEKTRHWATDFLVDGQQEISTYLSRRCTIPNVSAAVFKNDPKIPFVKYLKDAKQFTQVGDWYFYLQVLTHGKLAYSHQSLNFFRIHQNSATARSNRLKSATHAQEIAQIQALFRE